MREIISSLLILHPFLLCFYFSLIDFLDFYFVYKCSLFLQVTSVLRNILKTSASVSSGFPNMRKQMKARGRRPSAFIVFECLETPMKHEARVFDIASQSKLKLRRRKRNKIVKMLIKIRFPNHRHGYDFLCYNLLNKK